MNMCLQSGSVDIEFEVGSLEAGQELASKLTALVNEVRRYSRDAVEVGELHKHLELHKVTADEYRAMFGIPWNQSLTSAPSREATSRTIQPHQLAALHEHRPKEITRTRRPLAPAVNNQWLKNAEVGRSHSRTIVEVECHGGCGLTLETTALCAVQPIYCDHCATPGALKQRRRYRRKGVQ